MMLHGVKQSRRFRELFTSVSELALQGLKPSVQCADFTKPTGLIPRSAVVLLPSLTSVGSGLPAGLVLYGEGALNIRSFRKVGVAIIGGGAGGLSAAQEVSSFTDDYLLIGKALLSLQRPRVLVDRADKRHRQRCAGAGGPAHGEAGGAGVCIRSASAGLQLLREQCEGVLHVGSVDISPDKLIDGEARLIGPNHVQVAGQIVEANAVVVAMGSRAIVPRKWKALADDILSTDRLLAMESLPASLAVIGLGVEGLALAQAMQRLGVHVSGFDTAPQLAGVRDPDVAAEALAIFGREFPIVLGRNIDVQREQSGFRVSAGPESVVVDHLLVTQGSRSNAACLGWHQIGVGTDERGVPLFDAATLRVPGTSVFIVGEAVDGPPDPQSLVAQGRVASFNAVHRSLRRMPDVTPLSIAFSDPNIAVVGEPFGRLDTDRTVSARLRISRRTGDGLSRTGSGMLKLYADRKSSRLLGGAMIGPGYEHIAHLLAAFVQQRLNVQQALDMPFFHPLIEEPLRSGLMALQRLMQRLPRCHQGPPVIRPSRHPGIGLVSS